MLLLLLISLADLSLCIKLGMHLSKLMRLMLAGVGKRLDGRDVTRSVLENGLLWSGHCLSSSMNLVFLLLKVHW